MLGYKKLMYGGDIVEMSGRKKDKLIQFAKNLSDIKPDKLTWPMLWSQKIDGVFCMAVKTHTGVTIYSRTGEVYTSMRHIEDELSKVLNVDEIVIFEAHSVHTKDQPTISGWARDTKCQQPGLYACCHDLLFLDELIQGGYVEYAYRFGTLRERLQGIDKSIVTLIEQQYVKSLEEAIQLAELVWIHGGEGAVLRNPKGLYAPGKRNADVVKIKQGVSFDLEVLYVQEGKGKYEDTVGTLVCRWKDGQTISISGMTDEQRKKWWDGTEYIVGKVVQVDAMAVSSKGLLREPRFKGIRTDKTVGDF